MMPCENCKHTTQHPSGELTQIFWCPRCGTLKTSGGVPASESPMIVERLRDVIAQLGVVNHVLDAGDEVILNPGSVRHGAIRVALLAAEECLKPEERRTK